MSDIDVKELRRKANATQEEMAAKLRVPVGTYRNWEQRRCQPTGPSRALLSIFAQAIEARDTVSA